MISECLYDITSVKHKDKKIQGQIKTKYDLTKEPIPDIENLYSRLTELHRVTDAESHRVVEIHLKFKDIKEDTFNNVSIFINEINNVIEGGNHTDNAGITEFATNVNLFANEFHTEVTRNSWLSKLTKRNFGGDVKNIFLIDLKSPFQEEFTEADFNEFVGILEFSRDLRLIYGQKDKKHPNVFSPLPTRNSRESSLEAVDTKKRKMKINLSIKNLKISKQKQLILRLEKRIKSHFKNEFKIIENNYDKHPAMLQERKELWSDVEIANLAENDQNSLWVLFQELSFLADQKIKKIEAVHKGKLTSQDKSETLKIKLEVKQNELRRQEKILERIVNMQTTISKPQNHPKRRESVVNSLKDALSKQERYKPGNIINSGKLKTMGKIDINKSSAYKISSSYKFANRLSPSNILTTNVLLSKSKIKKVDSSLPELKLKRKTSHNSTSIKTKDVSKTPSYKFPLDLLKKKYSKSEMKGASGERKRSIIRSICIV